jgi:hypothetical protein
VFNFGDRLKCTQPEHGGHSEGGRGKRRLYETKRNRPGIEPKFLGFPGANFRWLETILVAE